MLKRLTLVVSFLIWALPVQAQENDGADWDGLVAHYSPGADSCGTVTEWKKNAEKNGWDMRYEQAIVFVGGYISSYNSFIAGPAGQLSVEGNADLIGAAQTDMNGVMAWIDNYCEDNPLDVYPFAIEALIEELSNKAQ